MLAECDSALTAKGRKGRKAQNLFAAFAPFAVNLFLVVFQRFTGKVIERVCQHAKHDY
jgi:hypothetical protein